MLYFSAAACNARPLLLYGKQCLIKILEVGCRWNDARPTSFCAGVLVTRSDCLPVFPGSVAIVFSSIILAVFRQKYAGVQCGAALPRCLSHAAVKGQERKYIAGHNPLHQHCRKQQHGCLFMRRISLSKITAPASSGHPYIFSGWQWLSSHHPAICLPNSYAC